jgi:mono/diheme cytochrome c family protein
MKVMLKALLLLVVSGVILLVVAFVWVGSRGISARAEPGRLETAVARTMRRLAIPSGERDRRSPLAATPDVIAAGMKHYADHCAACHANDGSGATDMGRGLYPKAPDMRLEATQALTDGELFSIIQNGIRLTGMPAWGSGRPEDAEQTWHLVHFIRELPRLAPEQIEQMTDWNPRSAEAIRQAIEEEEFLRGGDAPPPPPSTHGH